MARKMPAKTVENGRKLFDDMVLEDDEDIISVSSTVSEMPPPPSPVSETRLFDPSKPMALEADKSLQSREVLQNGFDPKMRIARWPSAKILRAYQDFLELGAGRNLIKLAERYQEQEEKFGQGTAPTTSLSTLRAWSHQFQWKLQASIDEATLTRERIESRRNSARSMAERQSQAAQVMQRIAMLRLKNMMKDGELTKDGLDITPAEARRFLTEGGKLERELFGGEKVILEDGEEISYE